MKPITYTSEQAQDYTAALTTADTLPALRAVLEAYAQLFPDAQAAAPRDEAEFAAWRAGLRKERRGKFAGDAFMERFGAVLIPEPWGCAFIRMQETGRVAFDDGGVARVVR